MKQLIYILLFILSAQLVGAKENSDLKKAEFLYSHLAYHEAITYYRKVSPVPNDAAVLSRIGDCYRLTKDPQSANTWYARAVALPGCADATKLYYAQTLMTVQHDTLAATMLLQYLVANPKDSRAQNMLAGCERADSMMAQAPTGYAQLLSFNTNGSDFGPALRRNQLFFTSDTAAANTGKTDNWSGSSFYNIYTVANNNIAASYGVPVQLPGKANDKYHDGPCTFDADGNMYFTRTGFTDQFFTKSPVEDRNGIVRLQIMIAADYDEVNKRYRSTMPFAYNSKDYSVAHPSVSKDGLKMFFVSDMNGGIGGTDIYVCDKAADGSWGSPVNVGAGINTEGNELFPFIDLDNTLYFASDGHIGFGGLDIYRATYNKATHAYNAPQNMGMPVNSSYDDMSLIFNSDGTVGYFASDRPAAKKGDNIYSFTPRSVYLSLAGTDSFTKMPVGNYTLSLLDCDTRCKMTAQADGRLVSQLYPRVTYTWLITAPHYQPQYLTITDSATSRSTDTVYARLKFDPRANISLHLAVYDEGADTAVLDSRIVCYKAGQALGDTVTVSRSGVAKIPLEANNTYRILPLKNNYSGREKVISTAGITPEAGPVVIAEHVYLKRRD